MTTLLLRLDMRTGISVLAVVLALAPQLMASRAEVPGLAVDDKLSQAEAGLVACSVSDWLLLWHRQVWSCIWLRVLLDR